MRNMNRKKVILLGIAAGLVLAGCSSFGSKLLGYKPDYKLGKVKKIIYFQPAVFPEIEEIKSPTNQAFFSAVTDQMSLYSGNIKTVQMDSSMDYDNVDTEYIKEVGKNNNAEAIIVPKVKYFKVGIGKYVFSNQVLVSLKLYDSDGNLIMENQYDTYKGNARLIGKAENSIKVGTKGAIKDLIKNLRKLKMF